jgi:hypothetical protein
MSKPAKPAMRIVESGNSEGRGSTLPSLAGIRQLPDGSLEYGADASDASPRWLPLSSPIRVVALTRDGDIRRRSLARRPRVRHSFGSLRMAAALRRAVKGLPLWRPHSSSVVIARARP